MKILSIELVKFKPLMHNGIDSINIDVTAPVICVIGQNGCGKSSLFRELTVYTPTSSDYEAGGKKKITVEDRGSIYVLESIFDGKKGHHSFIKDGESLNISNNSTTQDSLCETHFGVTKMESNITGGEVSISSMTPSERKAFLLNCYPSSLDFLLQHHRTVLSKLKGIKSNLKMLKERQCELTDAKMEDSCFKNLSTLIDNLANFRITMDSWMRTLAQEISRWKTHPSYTSMLGKSTVIDHASVKAKCDSYIAQALHLRNTTPHLFNDTDVSGTVQGLTFKQERLSEIVQMIRTQATALAGEISEHEGLADKNYDEEIALITNELNDVTKIISEFYVQDLPVLDKELVAKLDLYALQRLLAHLHTAKGSIISSVELSKIESRCQELRYDIMGVTNSINQIQPKHADVKRRHARHMGSAYNAKCVLQCQLKDNFNSVAQELEQDMNELHDRLVEFDARKKDLEKELEALNIRAQPVRDVSSSMAKIENFFQRYEWTSYISKGRDLVSILNNDPFYIYNQLGKIVSYSSAYHRNADLLETQKNLKYRLEVTEASKKQTHDFICRNLLDKKVELKKLTDDYGTSKYDLEKINKTLDSVRQVSTLEAVSLELKEEVICSANFLLIAGKIKILEETIRDLQNYRKCADAKQLEINEQFREQTNIRVRLEEEVLPNIKNLERELIKYTELEQALSPTSGIAHKAMVRFTNAIIRSTNEYIRHVWAYDLELVEMKETQDLDFILPVRLNKNSTVKDVSVCSKGQKEIIDLAWTVALCITRQLGQNYPLKLDEPDSGLSSTHRAKLLGLISLLIRRGDIRQLFLINHHSSLFSAFANSQVVCLSSDGIAVPSVYNIGVIINDHDANPNSA